MRFPAVLALRMLRIFIKEQEAKTPHLVLKKSDEK
jgi:hypothetical protein